MTKTAEPVALVLGSGGARGLAHIGVLKWFEAQGIAVDLIVGTSIGAMIGGLYASGASVRTLEKAALAADRRLVAKMFRPSFSGPGVVDPERVKDYVGELLGEETIERFPVRFAAVATDLLSGGEVVLGKGSAADAIAASIAIPTVFHPVLHQGRYLIDGGLCNPLPISVARALGARTVVAVNVAPNPSRIHMKLQRKKNRRITLRAPAMLETLNTLLPEGRRLRLGKGGDAEKETVDLSVVRVIIQSITIGTNNLLKQHLNQWQPDILLNPHVERFDLLDFHKAEEIIRCGSDAAQRIAFRGK